LFAFLFTKKFAQKSHGINQLQYAVLSAESCRIFLSFSAFLRRA